METMISTLIGISDVLCVTLSKLHNVSHHQLPLLQNGSDTTHFARLLLHLKGYEIV